MRIRSCKLSSFAKFLLPALLLFFAGALRAQTYLEVFGQNRVQYRKYEWKFFDTKHFRIYHYDAAGRQLARYLAEQAELDIPVIEQRLGNQFPDRFKIILYNNYDEYRQTNVGLKYESQLENISAGTVDLAGDRLVVYFTGVHADLRRQLRTGMARVVMQRLLFGDNFKDVLKNAVMLDLPAWVTEGFIAYLVDGWDVASNDQWKNILGANPKKKFHDLAEQYPELAGHAFWKYVSDHYGQQRLKDLLYMMENKSGIAQGVKVALGAKVVKVYDSCVNFYRGQYAEDALRHEMPDSLASRIRIRLPKDGASVREIKLSPRGTDVAYATWLYGEFKVYIQKVGAQSPSVVVDGGRMDFNEKSGDPNYPMLAWSNSGYKLAILYKKGTDTRIRIYNSLKAKIENYVIPQTRFDRITGVTFMENDTKLIMSAIKKSQSDLYEFTIKGSRVKNLTNDPWDDLSPSYVSFGARRGVVFLSNRTRPNITVPIGVNELPVGPLNVFFYDTKTRNPVLLQCSQVKYGNASQPVPYGDEHFAYLYDSSGIRNKYVVMFDRTTDNLDSAYSLPVSDYSGSIVSHQYDIVANKAVDIFQEGKYMRAYYKPIEIPNPDSPARTITPALLVDRGQRADSSKGFIDLRQVNPANGPFNEPVILQSGDVFNSDFENDSLSVAPVRSPSDSVTGPVIPALAPADTVAATKVDSTYLKLKAQPYRLSFKPDFLGLKVDNSILFSRYQSADYNKGRYTNPQLGGMLIASLNDVLENHRFTGGIRLPLSFSNPTTAYFLQYENFTNRIDWGLLFFRNAVYNPYKVDFTDPTSGTVIAQNDAVGKVSTYQFQGNATYPLDRIRSIRATTGIRADVLDFKATDSLSLLFLPRDKQYWNISRLEYVFDNSISPALNVRRGFRYKLYLEYLYRFTDGGSGLYNFGVDARYYKKVYKNITAAFRFAGAHSDGKEKILYLLGGVDNWLLPRQSNRAAGGDGEYGFQSLATNLRGYDQGARSGNTYAVVNAELRVPVLPTLLHRPIKSVFLRQFQVIGFADVGSAWNGLLPEGGVTVNQVLQPSGPQRPTSGPTITALVNQYTDNTPGVGYGFGLRSVLLGYFMRLDFAWNAEMLTNRPAIYLSFGTDF